MKLIINQPLDLNLRIKRKTQPEQHFSYQGKENVLVSCCKQEIHVQVNENEAIPIAIKQSFLVPFHLPMLQFEATPYLELDLYLPEHDDLTYRS